MTVVTLTPSLGAQQASSLPTAANIREKLRLTVAAVRAEDDLLVALVGPGLALADAPTVGYFCPLDGDPAKPESLLGLAEIYAQLRGRKAASKTVILDVTRSA